jgi:DNA-binding MarR family transcriptional regulator
VSRTQKTDTDQTDTDQTDADPPGHNHGDPAGHDHGDSPAALAAWDALQAIRYRVSKLIDTELWHDYKLVPRQLTILRSVAAAPGGRLTLPALRDKLNLPAADVSQLCSVLETRGVLVRRRTGHSTVLSLTGTGVTLTRTALHTQLNCIHTHLLARLNAEETTALAALLTRINQP